MEDPQHTPIFYIVNRLWVEHAGTSVAALRTMSAVFGAFALVMMFLLARELSDSRLFAWIATALLAVSPFQVLYAQEAREYTLWSVTILASSALLLRAVRLGTRWSWTAYAACCVLSMYVFPLSALLIASHGVYLIAGDDLRRRASGISYLAASGSACVLFLPWLISSDLHSGVRGLSVVLADKLSLKNVILAFLRDVKSSLVDFGFFGSHRLRLVSFLVGLTTTGLVGYALFVLRKGGDHKIRDMVFSMMAVTALPLVAHDVFFRGDLVLQARYFIPLYIGALLALANVLTGLLAAGPRLEAIGAAAFSFLLAIGMVSDARSSQATTWWNKDDERSPKVAAIINRSENPLVIGDRGTSRVLGLSFYLDPGVALRVNLHCDNCGVSPSVRAHLDANISRYSVFSLGGTALDLALPVLEIGVKTYPSDRAPLNMFLAAR